MGEKAEKTFKWCKLCGAKVSRLNRHYVHVHLHDHSELLDDFLEALADETHGDRLKCKHCNMISTVDRLPRHYLSVHGAHYLKLLAKNVANTPTPNPNIHKPLKSVVDIQTGMGNVDPRKFEELLHKLRLTARKSERCECKKTIVFVALEPNRLKAFDVDHLNRLTGPHSCDGPRSESVFAFNGGAIDSNRRKH